MRHYRAVGALDHRMSLVYNPVVPIVPERTIPCRIEPRSRLESASFILDYPFFRRRARLLHLFHETLRLTPAGISTSPAAPAPLFAKLRLTAPRPRLPALGLQVSAAIGALRFPRNCGIRWPSS